MSNHEQDDQERGTAGSPVVSPVTVDGDIVVGPVTARAVVDSVTASAVVDSVTARAIIPADGASEESTRD